MNRARCTIVPLALALALLGAPSGGAAQAGGGEEARAGAAEFGESRAGGHAPRDLAFGFSGVTYLFEAIDQVYTDADEHLPGNVGFRLSKAWFGERRWGLMLDTELYLGVADRTLLDSSMPNTIFGLQAFLGPALAVGPVQFYALGGVNRTTVGESQIVEVPGLVVIRYIGSGGLSNVWAAHLNALAERSAGTGTNVIASIPRYEEVSPAAVFGGAFDFGGGGTGFRLSIDYLPIFIGPTRNNFRVTLSVAG